MSYVRPAILYGSEAWCLNESEMGILQSTESSIVRAMCGVQHKDRKRSTDFMLGLSETINHLSMANCLLVWSCVEGREGGHVVRLKGQRKKAKLKRTWKRQVEEECVKVGLRREDELCRLMWRVGINQIVAGLR